MTAPARPLWSFGRAHLPVRADGRKLAADVTHWCAEGDREWTRAEGAEAAPVPAVAWRELLGDLADDRPPRAGRGGAGSLTREETWP